MDSGYITMDSSQLPLPLPRDKSPSIPLGTANNGASNIKKPVPLPRKSLGSTESNDSKKNSSSDIKREKSMETKIKSNGFKDDTLTKSYNTLTKSLKNEFKSASGSVQEKSKAVLESTKIVSARFEKSVRGMLTRRPSTMTVSTSTHSINDSENCNKRERCQSLPGEEIFHSISFDSPLSVDSSDTINENMNEDSDFEESAPPPSFPPPPLPDESLYDEVQSVKSSNSGSACHSYENYSLPPIHPSIESDSNYYEAVPILKKLGAFQVDSSTDSDEKSLSSETHKTLFEDRRNCQRSESWSFYDTTHVVPDPRPHSTAYENILLPEHTDNVIKFNKTVQNIYTQCPSVVDNSNCSNSDQETITPKSSLRSSDIIDGTLQSLSSSGSEHLSMASRSETLCSRPESTLSSLSIANELYDSWDPIAKMREVQESNTKQKRKRESKLSKSVILEFDPLYENILYTALESENAPKECLTEEFDDAAAPVGVPHSPRYSTIGSDNNSDDNDLEKSLLPVPPERYDSISQSSSNTKDIPNDVEYYLYHRTKDKSSGNVEIKPTFSSHVNLDTSENNFNSHQMVDEPSTSASESPEREGSPGKRRSNIVRWSSMKRAINKMVTDSSNWSPGVIRRMSKSGSTSKLDQESLKNDFSDRPTFDPVMSHIHSGFIFRSPSGGEKPKDFSQKWCQMGEGKLNFSTEKNCNSGKDSIPLESISSIQIVRDVKSSTDGEDVHCVELTVLPKARTYLLGSPGTTERRIWMQKILESLVNIFPAKVTADYTRAGWSYLKEGVSGDWIASWILLYKRSLYYTQYNNKIKEIDLRKARCVGLQDGDKHTSCPRAAEGGPHVFVDAPDQAVYLQMEVVRETKSWRHTIRAAAVDNGPNLSDQQLSRNNVPVIVEKCINFVYAHGLMSEGIYRRSGANSNVTKLLSAFQTDAWAVQLKKQDTSYTEYDVANVLKRFLRDLPEPIFTTQLHKLLCNTVGLKCAEEDKLSLYRTQLEQLPAVNYVTIKLLLSHLYALHQQRERNLMPIENLASIWAPTLMLSENTGMGGPVDVNWSRREAEVIGELISLYPKLFMVDSEEIAKERRMQEVLEKYHNSTTQQHLQMAPPAGDLRIWIHIGSKDSTNCVQITVTPQLTAGEVCISLCGKLNASSNKLCLMETILDGALHRPLHHMENVLDNVLRWSYWDDVDRKNNCLVLAHNTLFEELAPLIKQSVPKSGELKFADRKSKSFKSYVFEFSQAKLSYYKDKAGAQKLGEWRIEDIIWYFGHEPKRNPRMRWSITFIENSNRQKRSKDCPFFGCTIAGTSREEQLKWVTAMLVGQYSHSDLFPLPVPVNLLG